MVLFLLTGLKGSNAFAEIVPCTLEGTATGSEVAATVAPPGDVPLFLVCNSSATAPKTINLILSDFWNETGSVHVGLVLPPETQPVTQGAGVTIPFATIVLIRLYVAVLPTDGKYTGRLVITADGKDPVLAKLVLTRGAPTATLVVDGAPGPLQVSRSLFGCDSGRSFTVTLREKSGQVGIDGIRVRLDQVSKQPGGGFNLKKNLAFTVNATPANDLDVWPPNQPESYRSFATGGQAVVGMNLLNLEPGEYNAVLRFQASNSAENDSQKVPLVIQVRSSIWWAIFWLLVAVGFSFVATKVITSMWHRYVLLGRIRALRPAWLNQEPPVLPVVWVRAVLKESEDLSHRFWLTGADQIDARVNQVSAMIGLLDTVRRMRDQLMKTDLPRLPRIRAIAALDRIVGGLGDEAPDDAGLAATKAKLAGFNNWLQPATMADCYWASVCAEITRLQGKLALSEVTDVQSRAIMSQLASAIKAALQQRPQDLEGMMAVERQYAALKILWQWHDSAEFPQFIAVLPPPQQAQLGNVPPPVPASPGVPPLTIDDGVLHRLFQLADQSTWELLKDAVGAKSVKIVLPRSDGSQPLEAYDSLRFEIQPGDHRIETAFLFKHALTFDWTIELEYRRQWMRLRGSTKSLVLSPRTTEPRVVQYVPHAGTVAAKVKITDPSGDSVTVDEMDGSGGTLVIAASSDFGIFRGLARVEKISWVLAAIVAVVTGLSMFYFKRSSFGSFQDYVTLFLWGAGVDQGKNFLQALQSYSAPPPKSG